MRECSNVGRGVAGGRSTGSREVHGGGSTGTSFRAWRSRARRSVLQLGRTWLDPIRGTLTKLSPGSFWISATASRHWLRPSIARLGLPRSFRTTSSVKTSGPGSRRFRCGLDTSSFSVPAWLLSLSVIAPDIETVGKVAHRPGTQMLTNSIPCSQRAHGLGFGSIHRHRPQWRQSEPFLNDSLRPRSTPPSDPPSTVPSALRHPLGVLEHPARPGAGQTTSSATPCISQFDDPRRLARTRPRYLLRRCGRRVRMALVPGRPESPESLRGGNARHDGSARCESRGGVPLEV